MRDLASRFLSDESGATAIEYGLILALMTVALIAGLSLLSEGSEGMFDEVMSKVSDAITGALA